jgi:hypothetical protein
MSPAVICSKALSLFPMLKEQDNAAANDETFVYYLALISF